MPKMLADDGKQRSVKEAMRQILERSTSNSWKLDRTRLLGLLAELGTPTLGLYFRKMAYENTV
jgi:hypothetical protein